MFLFFCSLLKMDLDVNVETVLICIKTIKINFQEKFLNLVIIITKQFIELKISKFIKWPTVL